MAKVIPIVVSNADELAQAIKLQRTAILVKNKEMYDALIARENKKIRRKKASKIGKASSAAIGVGSFIAALFGPVGIFVAATYALTASVLAFGGSALAGIDKSELDKYKVALDEEHEWLVLWKVKGQNAMQNDDTVDIPKT